MKRKLKLISAISILIFNLFVCFASVFAWFYASRQNSGENINMMIDANLLSVTFQYYKYDIEEKEVIEIDDRVNFNDYDLWNLPTTEGFLNNDHTAIVLKTTLFSNVFKANEEQSINISWHCSSDSETDYVFSNILYLNSTAEDIDETNIYFNVKAVLEDETKHTFITKTKLTDISYSISAIPAIDNYIVIYSVIDYNSDCAIFKALRNNAHGEFSNMPEFDNDLADKINFGVNA